MLVSAINMKLRDSGDTLDGICNVEGVDKLDLIEQLKNAGFEYMPEINQFR